MLPDGALATLPNPFSTPADKFAEDRDNPVDVHDDYKNKQSQCEVVQQWIAQITFASTAIGEKHLRNFAQSFSGVHHLLLRLTTNSESQRQALIPDLIAVLKSNKAGAMVENCQFTPKVPLSFTLLAPILT